jgi:hypothetical protein
MTFMFLPFPTKVALLGGVDYSKNTWKVLMSYDYISQYWKHDNDRPKFLLWWEDILVMWER